MKLHSTPVAWSGVLAAVIVLSAGTVSAQPQTVTLYDAPEDPVLHLDPVDPDTGWPAVIVPDAPWIRPGSDGIWGTSDDEIDEVNRGDVDLLIRADPSASTSSWDLPSPLRVENLSRATAEPFGEGTPIPFRIHLTDGTNAIDPSYLEGLPFLVLAFADLDDDGYVGVTHLDGDVSDYAIEEAELRPVGRRYAVARHGRAEGDLFVEVGSPSASPLRVALTAAALAGPFAEPDAACMSCHQWPGTPAHAAFAGPFAIADPSNLDVVPVGPAIMTHMPFLPLTDVNVIMAPGPAAPELAYPDGRVRIQALPAWIPDPMDDRLGETFTMHLDGRHSTIDVAESVSGAPTRFGLAQIVDPEHYRALPDRPIRPGRGPTGERAVFEVVQTLLVADDGSVTRTRLHVVALDRLGNVTTPGAATSVDLTVGPGLVLRTPDFDGDPKRETVVVSTSGSFEVEVDDLGQAYDGPDASWILVEDADTISRIEVGSPDPDLDGDGIVGSADLSDLEGRLSNRRGSKNYLARFDLDTNGVIDFADLILLLDHFGGMASVQPDLPDAAPAPPSQSEPVTDPGPDPVLDGGGEADDDGDDDDEEEDDG